MRYEQGFYIPEDGTLCVRFEVFTAVTMRNGVFWERRNIPEDGILHGTLCIAFVNLCSRNVLAPALLKRSTITAQQL
jgi:hypothetical protein